MTTFLLCNKPYSVTSSVAEKSNRVKNSQVLDLSTAVKVTRYGYNQPSFGHFDRSATKWRNLILFNNLIKLHS